MSHTNVRLSVYILLICCALPLMAQSADSVVPGMVKFTGALNDSSGKPLTGTVGVTFLLYKEQSGGTPLWMETQNVQADKTGHYSVMLGSATSHGIPAKAFSAGEARWLAVQPSGQNEIPRVMLASVPYSLKALDAETLGGRPASSFMTAPAAGAKGTSSAQPAEQANEIVCASGTACKAAFIPLFATHGGSAKVKDSVVSQSGTIVTVAGAENVNGNFSSGGSVTANGDVTAFDIVANNNATVTNAVSVGGILSSKTVVVSPRLVGDNPTPGDGNISVIGSESATGNAGVTTGVLGLSESDSGRGVFGQVTGSSGVGVWGEGLTVGAAEDGVVGISHGPASGLFGANDHSSGIGVSAINDFGGDAIYAEALHGGFAAFFNGDVDVDGTLSKAAGSFKIDHPLDPANKYLYHSFVESPDMMNIYNGIVTLDAEGSAAVQLPDWFGALNRDYRYQLTAVGAAAPNLHIAEKVQNNAFKIGGGQPGMEVSWQVTGIRQDEYANAHRIPLEQAKPEQERGLYLHPELFGAPPEKSIAAARHPNAMKLANASNTKPISSTKQ